VDEVTGLSRLVVAEAADEKRQPAIVIKGAKGNKRYLMPSRAHLMIQDGDEVFPGDVLAKIPRETTRTKDITGGLPRVVELFEARKPRETAIMAVPFDSSWIEVEPCAIEKPKLWKGTASTGCGKTSVLYQGTTLVRSHKTENASGFRACVRTRKTRNIRIVFGQLSIWNRIDFARKSWLSRRLFRPCYGAFCTNCCLGATTKKLNEKASLYEGHSFSRAVNRLCLTGSAAEVRFSKPTGLRFPLSSHTPS
jgi:hypothetical protein